MITITTICQVCNNAFSYERRMKNHIGTPGHVRRRCDSCEVEHRRQQQHEAYMRQKRRPAGSNQHSTLQPTGRRCAGDDCTTILSVYNDDEYCAQCEAELADIARAEEHRRRVRAALARGAQRKVVPIGTDLQRLPRGVSVLADHRARRAEQNRLSGGHFRVSGGVRTWVSR